MTYWTSESRESCHPVKKWLSQPQKPLNACGKELALPAALPYARERAAGLLLLCHMEHLNAAMPLSASLTH
jgi:hypothetical protein